MLSLSFLLKEMGDEDFDISSLAMEELTESFMALLARQYPPH
jgi:hypothetical protein